MTPIKKILIVSCALFCLTPYAQAQHVDRDQARELNLLIKELDYLNDRVQRLEKVYKNDTDPIAFNYSALSEQLLVTRNRIAEFINIKNAELKVNAPIAIDRSLTKKSGGGE